MDWKYFVLGKLTWNDLPHEWFTIVAQFFCCACYSGCTFSHVHQTLEMALEHMLTSLILKKLVLCILLSRFYVPARWT